MRTIYMLKHNKKPSVVLETVKSKWHPDKFKYKNTLHSLHFEFHLHQLFPSTFMHVATRENKPDCFTPLQEYPTIKLLTEMN